MICGGDTLIAAHQIQEPLQECCSNTRSDTIVSNRWFIFLHDLDIKNNFQPLSCQKEHLNIWSKRQCDFHTTLRRAGWLRIKLVLLTITYFEVWVSQKRDVQQNDQCPQHQLVDRRAVIISQRQSQQHHGCYSRTSYVLSWRCAAEWHTSIPFPLQ